MLSCISFLLFHRHILSTEDDTAAAVWLVDKAVFWLAFPGARPRHALGRPSAKVYQTLLWFTSPTPLFFFLRSPPSLHPDPPRTVGSSISMIMSRISVCTADDVLSPWNHQVLCCNFIPISRDQTGMWRVTLPFDRSRLEFSVALKLSSSSDVPFLIRLRERIFWVSELYRITNHFTVQRSVLVNLIRWFVPCEGADRNDWLIGKQHWKRNLLWNRFV